VAGGAGGDRDQGGADQDAPSTIDSARLHMATDYTPYQGLPVRGRVDTVIAAGRPVIDNGVLIDLEPGGDHWQATRCSPQRGAFLETPLPFAADRRVSCRGRC
jgi:hypothetical protein